MTVLPVHEFTVSVTSRGLEVDGRWYVEIATLLNGDEKRVIRYGPMAQDVVESNRQRLLESEAQLIKTTLDAAAEGVHNHMNVLLREINPE